MEKNKVVIISGGTSGIGLATAKILASEGWKTILLGRDMSKGRGAQEEAQGSIFIPCDVTNTRIVKNAIEKAASLEKSEASCPVPVFIRKVFWIM